MIIEISRKQAEKLGSVEKAIKNGWFIIWNNERIKKAFNFGNGSKKDFSEYQRNNKAYCIFKDLPENTIKSILQKFSGA